MFRGHFFQRDVKNGQLGTSQHWRHTRVTFPMKVRPVLGMHTHTDMEKRH